MKSKIILLLLLFIVIYSCAEENNNAVIDVDIKGKNIVQIKTLNTVSNPNICQSTICTGDNVSRKFKILGRMLSCRAKSIKNLEDPASQLGDQIISYIERRLDDFEYFNNNPNYTKLSGDASCYDSAKEMLEETKRKQDIIRPEWNNARIKVLEVKATEVSLEWDEATDNVGIDKYDIYYFKLINGGLSEGRQVSSENNQIVITDLEPNTNYKFYIQAIDASGNYTDDRITIEVKTLEVGDMTKPEWNSATVKALNVKAKEVELQWGEATDNVAVTGYKVYYHVNGVEKGSLTTGTNQTIIRNLTPNTIYKFFVEAFDAAENYTENPITLKLMTPEAEGEEENNDIPDDLTTIATELKEGGSFSDGVSFIYEGDNKIQQDVENGAIKDEEVSIIRGKVVDNDDQPIRSVKISINNHSEFGFTYTKTNGEFDIAVNGDQKYEVSYQKEGFVTVQRDAKPEKNNFEVINKIVMIPYSTKVTVIDLNNINEIAVAQGEEVTDNDGTRKNVMLFSPQTTATAILKDGSQTQLSRISVRATEFTVGDNGRDRMPAVLPTNTAYTYAVELSVDEALNAKSVKFSKPVYNYVDNFIGFPVGGIVPTGYYDREQGKWIASKNGVVIKIISISDGMANIDTTGNNTPDNIYISNDERVVLAKLYGPGKELWRVPITHFTPWDCNWPYGCRNCNAPDGGSGDGSGDGSGGSGGSGGGSLSQFQSESEDDESCKESGSIIDVHKRTLGEVLPISGTGYNIFYNSSRVEGFKRNRAIGAFNSNNDNDINNNFIRKEMEVSVAGKKYITNGNSSFIWDGKDIYGRIINTPVVAKLKYSNIYKAEYMTPEDIDNSFNLISDGTFIEGDRESNIIKLTNQREVTLNPVSHSLKKEKLGGWDFGFHHKFHQPTKTLYLGNGEVKKVKRGNSYIKEFLSIKDSDLGEIDIGLGNNVNLSMNYDAIISNDHQNIYFHDNSALSYPYSYSINEKKITALGSKSVFVKLFEGNNLYSSNSQSIYKLNNGIEEEILSNYECETGGELFHITDFVVNNNNEVYAIDRTKSILIKISSDGLVTEILGDCDNINVDEGNVDLIHPYRIRIDENDNIYILDNKGIVKVDENDLQTIKLKFNNLLIADEMKVGDYFEDIISSNMGTHQSFLIKNDSIIYLYYDIIFFIDKHNVITRIQKLPEVTNRFYNLQLANDKVFITYKEDGEIYFYTIENTINRLPSEDGSLLYYFDEHGKHLKTVDALTGIELLKFGYNENGYLISVTDRDGNITEIIRGNDDYATKIIAPFGQETMLNIDEITGYLKDLTLPAERIFNMTYDTEEQDGLLLSFKNPNGAESKFNYDDIGLLNKDTNAEGGRLE